MSFGWKNGHMANGRNNKDYISLQHTLYVADIIKVFSMTKEANFFVMDIDHHSRYLWHRNWKQVKNLTFLCFKSTWKTCIWPNLASIKTLFSQEPARGPEFVCHVKNSRISVKCVIHLKSYVSVSLTMLWAISADDKLIIFSYFPRK